jgi:Protein of unknown function (DUF3037)
MRFMTDSAERGPLNGEHTYIYRVLRYNPNLLRDEWLNIGVLLFDPWTGERRLRLITDAAEFNRVRRLHPAADEALLRALPDELNGQIEQFCYTRPETAANVSEKIRDWQPVLVKWDDTLANTVQLAPQKATIAGDLDLEMARLYGIHVAPQPPRPRLGAPGTRADLRDYCNQVFRQAQLWNRLEKSIRAAAFTFPGDPMHIDYSYRRNGTRGFVQTLSVTRSPNDAKLLAYTAERIAAKSELSTEFAAITDVRLEPKTERHRFIGDTLRSAGIEPVALEGFAVWVAKLKDSMRAE